MLFRSTFEVTLDTTRMLMEKRGEVLKSRNILVVSESGLFTRDNLDQVGSYGAGAVLVGEALMRQDDLASAVKTLVQK